MQIFGLFNVHLLSEKHHNIEFLYYLSLPLLNISYSHRLAVS